MFIQKLLVIYQFLITIYWIVLNVSYPMATYLKYKEDTEELSI